MKTTGNPLILAARCSCDIAVWPFGTKPAMTNVVVTARILSRRYENDNAFT